VKHFVIPILVLFGLSDLSAQDRLNLISSRNAVINAQSSHSTYYNGVFEHKGSTLSADSSHIYEDSLKRQFFDAFGHVVITQPNGTVIYADKLHYDAAPQIAVLTNNVRMVDAHSVLTTNHLVYKMRSKIGTYAGGGRIVSKNDTITSENADYFENTQDAYFHGRVVVRTADATILTDSMRYNAEERMTYFFGPTNIKGHKGENLYTEKGDYHTEHGIARFSENNLYTEGARFLKGDSLYYERNGGIGKAFRNVVFVDTTDRFFAYGGYGLFDQAEGSITMTENPLVITVVQSDSTESAPTDSLAVVKDEMLLPQDSLAAQPVKTVQVDSVYLTADTLFSMLIPLRDYKPLQFHLDRNGGEPELDDEVDYGEDERSDEAPDTGLPETKPDGDFGQPKNTLENIGIPDLPTSLDEKSALPEMTVKIDTADMGANLDRDSLLRHQAAIPSGEEIASLMDGAMAAVQTPDIAAHSLLADTAASDTARTRIVKAYHNVRMFKSDLQAVADSVYYGMADSMFRFMGRPMLWAEGSQISSDTIYMQVLGQKLDNALLVGNAFMVNAVLDTVKFNQLKGRRITVFFANNNIDRLFVDGNAENLVFQADDRLRIVKEMFHDRGARIKVKMEGKKIIDYVTIRKADQKVYPFSMVTQENELLPGFIWRPQDRPTSKADMMQRKRKSFDNGQLTVDN